MKILLGMAIGISISEVIRWFTRTEFWRVLTW